MHRLVDGTSAEVVQGFELKQVDRVECQQHVHRPADVMVDGLRIKVLGRRLDVRVEPVEADELSDHVLKEALEPVGRVSKPLDGLIDVQLVVDVRQLAVELGVREVFRDQLGVRPQGVDGIVAPVVTGYIEHGRIQP